MTKYFLSFFRYEFGASLDSLRDGVGEGGFFELLAFGDLCTLLQFVMVDDVLKIRDSLMHD
jgi:hypothetical protein